MSDLATARSSIADVKRRMRVAADTLAREAIVDVSPLVPALDALAKDIAALPRDVAGTLKNELIALYQELDQLSRDLEAAQDALASKLKGLARGSQVSNAYGPRPRKA